MLRTAPLCTSLLEGYHHLMPVHYEVMACGAELCAIELIGTMPCKKVASETSA